MGGPRAGRRYKAMGQLVSKAMELCCGHRAARRGFAAEAAELVTVLHVSAEPQLRRTRSACRDACAC